MNSKQIMSTLIQKMLDNEGTTLIFNKDEDGNDVLCIAPQIEALEEGIYEERLTAITLVLNDGTRFRVQVSQLAN